MSVETIDKRVANKLKTVIENEQRLMANALKGTASGASVFLDDTSPVEHEMNVKVRSKNLIDASNAPMFGVYHQNNASVWGYEKTNTGLKFNAIEDFTPGTARLGYQICPVNMIKGKTVTLSFKRHSTIDDTNTTAIAMIIAADNDFTDDYTYITNLTNYVNYKEIQLKDTVDGYSENTFTIPNDETRKNLFILFYFGYKGLASAGSVVEYSDVQVEISNAATEYTSYIEDLSTVKVLTTGKNLLNRNATQVSYGTLVFNENRQTFYRDDENDGAARGDLKTVLGDYQAFVGKTITISYDFIAYKGTYPSFNTFLLADNSNIIIDGKQASFAKTFVDGGVKASASFVIPPDDNAKELVLRQYVGYITRNIGDYVTIDNLQVEFGDTVTEWAEHVEHTEHTVDASGAVEGVMGKGEDMTLYTDTVGAVIECNYNRDINKAFAELFNALISLGANV